MFGANNKPFEGTTGFHGFGATAQTGTTIKFNPPTGTYTLMMKNGVSTNVSTRYQSVTAMEEYENKSFEELRVEDYSANRKSGIAGGITFGSASQTAGLIGSTPAASTSRCGFTFRTPTSQFSFGATQSAFGSSGFILGQPAQNQNIMATTNTVSFCQNIININNSCIIIGRDGITRRTRDSLYGQNNQQNQPTNTTGEFDATNQRSIRD